MTTDNNSNCIPDGYITVEDAAQILGIDAQSIRKAINRGTIKGALKTRILIPYKVTVVPRDEVERYAITRRKRGKGVSRVQS